MESLQVSYLLTEGLFATPNYLSFAYPKVPGRTLSPNCRTSTFAGTPLLLNNRLIACTGEMPSARALLRSAGCTAPVLRNQIAMHAFHQKAIAV